MRSLIWPIAVGSAVGGVCRFLLTGFIQQRVSIPFPLGTLLVNVTGSIAIGFILRYALGSPSMTPEVRALIATGFLGGFTTFSAFSYETLALIESGDYGRASLYVVASVVLSLTGTFAGMAVADAVIARGRLS